LNDKRTTLCGTPNYIAPEILNKNGHGKPADVWSTGVAMFALLVGTPPFETSSLTATYRKIKENNYTIPSSYKRQAVGYMIKAMLNPKADQRPSVHKLIQDKFITTGFYPDSMPDSAMTCEPHFNHEQSICVYADQNVYSNGRETRSRSRSEIKNQETKASSSRRARVDQNGKMGNNDGQQDHDLLRAPLHEMNNVEINDRARNVLQNEPSTAPTTSEISFPEHGDQRLEGYDKMKKYAHDILSQLKFLDELFSKPTENRGVRFHKKVSDVVDMEDAVDPSIRPVYWISKWVDYSDKYGLGYQLIDESVGVLFNDNRRMILHSNQNHIQAIEEDMVREKMTTAKEIELNFKVSEQKYAKESQIRNSNPRSADEEKFIKLDSDFRQSKDLNKKYKLLKHFRQYMIAHLVTAGDEYKITSIDDLRRLPYLVKWFRTKHAICLMLTNGIVQINFFSCHSKLIFDPSVEAVTYINDKKQLTTFNIKNMQKTGIDTKFFMKLVEGKNLVVSLYKNLHPNSGITGKMIDSGGSLVASLAKAN
jgi:serine/threonine protein kinase